MRSFRVVRPALLSPVFSSFIVAGSVSALAGCDTQTGAFRDNLGEPIEAAALVQELHERKLGVPLPGLPPDQLALFNLGEAEFVRDLLPREGLGPVYIERSCVSCHGLGGIGGADDGKNPNHFTRRFFTITMGAYDPLSALGGDLQQTKSITGLQPFCTVPAEVVPPQATGLALRNPLQMFGNGLMDAISDATILAGAVPKGDGIQGRPNLDGAGKPGRFGWKAQGNTLAGFNAVAANGTLGLTSAGAPNEPRPQGNPIPAGCTDADVGASTPNDGSGALLSSINAWASLLAPPEPRTLTGEGRRGKEIFSEIGCAKCHTPQMMTSDYNLVLRNGSTLRIDALSNKPANLYSDLLLHDMGPDMDEKVVMRQARGSEFRTTPLWGLGSRKVFLHDGRANTIDEAIEAHGGTAQIVRDRYLGLRGGERLALLRFLRSL